MPASMNLPLPFLYENIDNKASSDKTLEFVMAGLHAINQLLGYPDLFIHNILSHIGVWNANLI